MRSPVARLLTSPLARFGAAIVAGLVLMALLAPWLVTHDPWAIDLRAQLARPSSDHWLGTDADGADIYSRLVWGARISLLVGVVTVSISATLGTLIGAVAGYFGGWIDRLLLFVIEDFMAFPGILLAIAITAIFPSRGVEVVIFALCVAGWVGYARLVRGQVMGLRDADYVTAAISQAIPTRTILRRHILPNVMAPLVVQATFGLASAILAEASLSFLGLGVEPGTPSWGAMLNQGRQYLLVSPGLSIYPGLAIMIVVMGFNFLGDGLRDALDPRRQAEG